MIEERLMQVGNWDLTLSEQTPQHVLDAIDFFGHVCVFTSRVDPDLHTDAELLAKARFAGPVHHIGLRDLAGPTMVGWLGDSDGKGTVYEQARTGTSASFVDQSFRAWIDDLIVVPNAPIILGTLHDVAGSLSHRFVWTPPKPALDYVCDYFAAEYRINPDGTIDAGAEADLFVTDPQAVIVPEAFGDDPDLAGLEPAQLARERDVEDYSTRIIVLGRGQGEETIVTGTDELASTPYRNIHGDDVVVKRIIESPDTDPAGADTLAAQQLGRFDDLRKAVQLGTDRYDVVGLVRPGDSVWVFDPTNGFYDLANQVQFRGQTIAPVKLRVYGIRWPVQDGMAVLFRHGDGTWVDLTDHVIFDTGDSTFEVGGRRRGLTAGGGDSASLSTRAGGGVVWVDWTPQLTAGATDPTLGSGAVQQGRYTRFGDLVVAQARIVFGTSGVDPGSGSYLVSLPVDSATDIGAAPAGSGHLFDDSANAWQVVAAHRSGADRVAMRFTSGTVRDNAPWTWAAGDEIRLHLTYEAA